MMRWCQGLFYYYAPRPATRAHRQAYTTQTLIVILYDSIYIVREEAEEVILIKQNPGRHSSSSELSFTA
jgi:hypothetical protein